MSKVVHPNSPLLQWKTASPVKNQDWKPSKISLILQDSLQSFHRPPPGSLTKEKTAAFSLPSLSTLLGRIGSFFQNCLGLGSEAVAFPLPAPRKAAPKRGTAGLPLSERDRIAQKINRRVTFNRHLSSMEGNFGKALSGRLPQDPFTTIKEIVKACLGFFLAEDWEGETKAQRRDHQYHLIQGSLSAIHDENTNGSSSLRQRLMNSLIITEDGIMGPDGKPILGVDLRAIELFQEHLNIIRRACARLAQDAELDTYRRRKFRDLKDEADSLSMLIQTLIPNPPARK